MGTEAEAKPTSPIEKDDTAELALAEAESRCEEEQVKSAASDAAAESAAVVDTAMAEHQSSPLVPDLGAQAPPDVEDGVPCSAANDRLQGSSEEHDAKKTETILP